MIKKLLTLALLSTSLQAAEKPNILFIFADDYAFDCLGAHGNSEVKTPNLDKLNARSTQFTHAYNSGAWHGAICVASRTMLMTGKQIWNAKSTKLKQAQADGSLFPQRMNAAGYKTYFAGKWHVGERTENVCKESFDVTRNIRPGMPHPNDKSVYNRTFKPSATDEWSPTDTTQGGYWKGGKHWSEVLADDGIAMLEQAKLDESPFFMMLCFNAPHDPRQAPKEFIDLYNPSEISVPNNFLPTYPYQIGSNKVRDERLAPFPRTPRSIQTNRAEYYALISHMDAQIGKILDTLEATGKADNTIIIFTADHGLSVGHHGLLGKQNLYDPSVRVPWMVAGPGIPKAKKVTTPIYLQSAMSTCIDLAGGDSNGLEFESVLPSINDKSSSDNPIYGCYTSTQRMVCTDKFKFITYPKINIELLFDREKDPLEMNNLIDNPELTETAKSLRKLLKEQMTKMNDPLVKAL